MTGLSYHITAEPRHRKSTVRRIRSWWQEVELGRVHLTFSVIEGQHRLASPVHGSPLPNRLHPTATISHRPLAARFAITDEASPFALRSTRNHPRRAMHHGCVAGANDGEEGRGGWWPTSPSSRWGGRSTTPVSSPRTTRSICPATASPQADGTAPAPPPWGCRAKHRRPGSRPCSKAATRRQWSCWAAPMAAMPCRPSMWSCGQPRASRSSTASETQIPAGRCSRRIMLGWPRRSAT
jgi:hypothetical protein